MAKKRQTAQELQQAQLKAHRQERMGQERRQCEAVISEFTGTDAEATLHAMAAEILEYRRGFFDAGARGRVCAFERTVRSDGSGPVVEAEAGA